VLKDKR